MELCLIRTTTTGCFTITSDSSSVLGCNDITAINYDTNAQVDDGSCIYPIFNVMILEHVILMFKLILMMEVVL